MSSRAGPVLQVSGQRNPGRQGNGYDGRRPVTGYSGLIAPTTPARIVVEQDLVGMLDAFVSRLALRFFALVEITPDRRKDPVIAWDSSSTTTSTSSPATGNSAGRSPPPTGPCSCSPTGERKFAWCGAPRPTAVITTRHGDAPSDAPTDRVRDRSRAVGQHKEHSGDHRPDETTGTASPASTRSATPGTGPARTPGRRSRYAVLRPRMRSSALSAVSSAVGKVCR